MGSRVAGGTLGYLLSRRAAGRLILWRSRSFAGLLKKSGRIGNPVLMAGASVAGAIKGALVAVPVSVLGGFLFSPWFFCGCAVPLLLLAAPELRLRDAIAQRKEGVEGELPFFSVLVGVLGGAGVPLYSILGDLSDNDVFPSMRKEALLVKRDVGIFGMNPNDSFERLASNHPSKRFGEFLLGYTSKARSGGDVPGYLMGESGSLLRELEGGWLRYVARVGIIGSMMITVFGVVPLLLMVVGVFSPGFSIVGLVFYTGVGVPMFTMALIYMAGRMQPAKAEPIQGKAAKSILVALPVAVLGVLSGEAWVAVASALFVFFVAYGFSVRKQLAETRAVDEGLSRFLKDLLEYKRQDYDLTRAIVAIEAHGGYNSGFSGVLSKVASRLKAGVPLDEVKVDCRSKLGRMSFLLLGQMSRSGGGSVDTVYQVSNFADRMIEMRRNATAEMKPYLILSYVSPLLLAFGVTFVGGVLSSFSSTVRPGLSGLHLSGFQVGSVPPGLTQVSDLLIVVSAASLGLIGAKITDLTVRNTIRASVNVGLAVAAVSLMVALNSHSLPTLFPK
ncbi:MAG: type II secretion system F family protein [Thaumarchaeota archaeon]|nr:type II secretion system F family protein [Nitrososphaerota archaeon]